MDQRSPMYGKPFSLLRPGPEADAFRRLRPSDICDALNEAAREKRVTYRADILADAGLVSDAFVFHPDGRWELDFASP